MREDGIRFTGMREGPARMERDRRYTTPIYGSPAYQDRTCITGVERPRPLMTRGPEAIASGPRHIVLNPTAIQLRPADDTTATRGTPSFL